MPEQHRLSLITRVNHSTSDGSCSCGKWSMRNHKTKDIREKHDDHVQVFLGPDAKREAC